MREPDPAEEAVRYARLVCGQCGSRSVDMVVNGNERAQRAYRP
jgi:hypothetical protein